MPGIRYTVCLRKSVEAALANLFLDRPADRKQISAAMNDVDRLLAVDPDRKGQPDPVHEGVRFIVSGPLRFDFSIHEADRKVEILTLAFSTDC